MTPAGLRLARGLRRHFEGWPWALWLVSASLVSAALVVPRRVDPDLVPPPWVDRRQQQLEQDTERQRAARAKAGLPLEVRSVGEALRRYGLASLDAPATAPQLRDQLRRLATVALERHGPERLLELRALQAELFNQAVAEREAGAAAQRDLRELGGKLAASGLERGWFEREPSGADASELATLFRIYWTETLGLTRQQPHAPTLNEWRAYYRFLLSRPWAPGREQAADVLRRLGYVAALSQHDREYPARLARGVLLYRSGAHAQAAAELHAHLQEHPDGAWSLRARNYLAACGAALIE